MKTYVVTNHLNHLTVLMMGHKICFYGEILLIIPVSNYLDYLFDARYICNSNANRNSSFCKKIAPPPPPPKKRLFDSYGWKMYLCTDCFKLVWFKSLESKKADKKIYVCKFSKKLFHPSYFILKIQRSRAKSTD